ncbi:hypothetical protein HPB47_014032 [Ixodes persulcatus]|uniref:Uncharacterized protein n=1 Tax=Ixodes persulcatus TaxID=34615 RepID=A0AC60QWZ9_IXOPE|nr:hypothetical protein HPB47_014032 [Ixodes persulcatus]
MPALTVLMTQMLLLLFTASPSTSDGDGACSSSRSWECPFNTESAAQEEAPAASLLTWPTWSLTDNNRMMAHRGTFPFPFVGCLQKHLPPLQSLGHDKAVPALTVFMTQPGDRVWVWTPIRRHGLSEKLLKRYFGPYSVLRRLGDLNYETTIDRDGALITITSTCPMKHVHTLKSQPVINGRAARNILLSRHLFFAGVKVVHTLRMLLDVKVQVPCEKAVNEYRTAVVLPGVDNVSNIKEEL